MAICGLVLILAAEEIELRWAGVVIALCGIVGVVAGIISRRKRE